MLSFTNHQNKYNRVVDFPHLICCYFYFVHCGVWVATEEPLAMSRRVCVKKGEGECANEKKKKQGKGALLLTSLVCTNPQLGSLPPSPFSLLLSPFSPSFPYYDFNHGSYPHSFFDDQLTIEDVCPNSMQHN